MRRTTTVTPIPGLAADGGVYGGGVYGGGTYGQPPEEAALPDYRLTVVVLDATSEGIA